MCQKRSPVERDGLSRGGMSKEIVCLDRWSVEGVY